MSLAFVSSLMFSTALFATSPLPAALDADFEAEQTNTDAFSAQYASGHLADFAPVVAGFLASEDQLPMIFMSEDPDLCAHLEDGQHKPLARSLFFALKVAQAGMYGVDVVRFAWGKHSNIASAHVVMLDPHGVDVGDARNVEGPSILPFGQGVVNTGWVRLDHDMDGDALSGEYSLSFGTQGYPVSSLQARFLATRCNAHLTP